MAIPEIYMPKDQGYPYESLGWDDGDAVEESLFAGNIGLWSSLTPLGVYRMTTQTSTEGRLRVIPASGSDPGVAAYNTAHAYRTETPLEIKLLPGQDRIGARNDTGATIEVVLVRIH